MQRGHKPIEPNRIGGVKESGLRINLRDTLFDVRDDECAFHGSDLLTLDLLLPMVDLVCILEHLFLVLCGHLITLVC